MCKITIQELQQQIRKTKSSLDPEADVYTGLCEMTLLIEKLFKYLEEVVDKKMHQVTKRMKTASKDIKKGEPKKAAEVLKKAEAKNEKLVKIDREVRDPMIKKCKAEMKGKK